MECEYESNKEKSLAARKYRLVVRYYGCEISKISEIMQLNYWKWSTVVYAAVAASVLACFSYCHKIAVYLACTFKTHCSISSIAWIQFIRFLVFWYCRFSQQWGLLSFDTIIQIECYAHYTPNINCDIPSKAKIILFIFINYYSQSLTHPHAIILPPWVQWTVMIVFASLQLLSFLHISCVSRSKPEQ